MKKVMTTLLVSLFSAQLWAGASMGKVDSFSALERTVTALKSPTSTLLVMDDDDTLTMMACPDGAAAADCQYLGGPAWFSWQQSLLGTDSPYRVAGSFNELLDIANVLFALNRMSYTDQNIYPVLSKLSGSGVRLLVETARGDANLNATEQQFALLGDSSGQGSGQGNLLQLLASNSLKIWSGRQPGLAAPGLPCHIPGTRDVTFQNGIYYLGGQNKGVMLACLLIQFEQGNLFEPSLPISHIVFIDDTLENVQDVYDYFRDSSRYQVTALHYTALEKHKAALTKGPKSQGLQDMANSRWQALQSAMKANLVSPIVR